MDVYRLREGSKALVREWDDSLDVIVVVAVAPGKDLAVVEYPDGQRLRCSARHLAGQVIAILPMTS